MFETANSSTTIVGGTGIVSSGTTTYYNWDDPINPISLINTTHISNPVTSNNMNKLQNHFVAVFKVERNDKNEITSAKFIKEMWIETKNGSSVDFEVAKDKDISQYSSDEIVIKTIYTVTF
jgi:hypothetical protein